MVSLRSTFTTALFPVRSKPPQPAFTRISIRRSHHQTHTSHQLQPCIRLQPSSFHCSKPLLSNLSHGLRCNYSSSSPTQPPDPESRTYTFPEIQTLSTSPNPRRLIIDVREPAELAETGCIPGAVSMPLTSNPDAFYLSEEDFEDRFEFEKPRARQKGAEMVDEAKEAEVEGQEGEKGGKGGLGRSPYTSEMKSAEAEAGSSGGDGEGEGQGLDSTGAGAKGKGRESEEGGGVDEVIFYCKAGVRSRAAARMAREWRGVKVGDMKGGWNEWSGKGGAVERG